MVLLLSIVFLVLSSVAPALAGDGLLITLHAPHRQHLILALDEIELDWSKQPGAKSQVSRVTQFSPPVVIENSPPPRALRWWPRPASRDRI